MTEFDFCDEPEPDPRHPKHAYVKSISVPPNTIWYVTNGRAGGEEMFLHTDGLWYDGLFDARKHMAGDFGSEAAADAARIAYLHKPYGQGGPYSFPPDPYPYPPVSPPNVP